MRGEARRFGCALIGVALAAGCAAVTVDRRAGFSDVAETVKDRTGFRVTRSGDAGEPRATAERVAKLLEDGLAAEEAVEIALVNNRDLQALYADLGVAQSDLVQASLLHNPVLDAAAGLPIGGGAVDLSMSLALDVIDFLYVPLRKRVAEAAFEETKLRIAGGVLDLVWRTRTAFYGHQANEQMLEMRRQIAESTQAALEVARRLREAGNVTELDLASQAALADEARLDWRLAEIAARESRERLNELMGLWGEEAAWGVASSRLGDPSPEPVDAGDLERRAVERSVDLAVARQRIVAAAEQLGLNRASALFPEVLVGGQGERDGPEWEPGPAFALPLPLFDRGQARTARAREELARATEAHHALAVRVRSTLRAARDRLLGHRERAVYYREVHLPLRERIVSETQLHYNAMQLGPLELLRAKEDQIEAGARYVEALREHWMARADLDLILAGRLPPKEAAAAPEPLLEGVRRSPIPTLN